jgi:superfamily II DNA or RNA helicase
MQSTPKQNLNQFFENTILNLKIGSFSQFITKTKNFTTKEKGDLFEVLCKFTYLIHPELSHQVKNIWLFKEIPDEIILKLNLPNQDKGIDLILQNFKNEYYAIQCKFRSNESENLNWDILSTFIGLSFGIGKQIKKGVLMTNCYSIVDEVYNSENIICIYGNFWKRLPQNFFKNIILAIRKKKSKYIAKIPYDYQINILNDCVEYYNNKNNQISKITKKNNFDSTNSSESEDENESKPINSNYEQSEEDSEERKDKSEQNDKEKEDLDEQSDEQNDKEEININSHIYGILDIACGCGKTLLSYWTCQKFKFNKIIILVPSLQLLSQFVQAWKIEDFANKINTQYLMIGSDSDLNFKDYCYINLTTVEDEICNFIENNDKFIIVSTYQSSDKLLSAINETGVTIDFCIFDEAHKTAFFKQKIINDKNNYGRQFSLFLDNTIKINKKLFMTATPRIYKFNDNESDLKKSKKTKFHNISMNDPKIYGNIIHSYKLGKAIEDNTLTDFEIIATDVTDNRMKKIIEENRKIYPFLYGSEGINAETLFYIIALSNCLNKFNCKHILTYHNKIGKYSENKEAGYINKIYGAFGFAGLLEKYKKIFNLEKYTFYHVSGETKVKERNEIIKKFANTDYSIICSARVFNEGIDIKEIDCVAFIDARESRIDIIQCLGRCLRKCPGKNMSRVIIPTYINGITDETEDEQFNSTKYKNLFSVMKAIKTEKNINVDITDIIVDENYEKPKNTKSGGIIRHLTFRNIDTKRSEQDDDINIKNFVNLDHWKEKIKPLIVYGIYSWEHRYSELKEYLETNDKYPSQHDNDPNIKKIAIWIQHQRENKKIDKISEYRIEQLELLKNWQWDILEDNWNDNYDKLKNYLEINDKYPSTRDKNINNKKISLWIITQRRNKKKKKISNEKIIKLEQLKNWKWEIVDITKIKKASWNKHYDELIKYLEHYDKYPKGHDEDTNVRKIGKWIQHQRENKKKNKISNEKIIKLEQLKNWQWELVDTTKVKKKSWEEHYEELRKFIEKNNKYPKDSGKDTNIRKIGKWVCNQRTNKKKNKISGERIKQLEKLNNWQWDVDDIWNENYEKLRNYLEINDKYPKDHDKDINVTKIGKWIQHQRENKKENKISEERIEKLEELKKWQWDILENTWNDNYDELRNYLKINGKYPSNSDKNKNIKKIGNWISCQRMAKNKNKISEDKIYKLEQLKNWKWGIDLNNIWNEHYNELKNYLENNDRIPKNRDKDTNIRKLGQWVSNQRRNKKINRLTKERIEKLEHLKDWHW